MALSKTDIANQALAKIGATTIMDLDSVEVQNARVCKNVFEPSVRELARAHRWNCLMDRAALARLSAAPAFGWDYQYPLPTNLIRLCRLNGEETYLLQDAFAIEGRNLLTDAETANVEYVAYVADSTKYDALFVECLALSIASKIAITIRQDETLARVLAAELDRKLGEARRIDGNERRKPQFNPAQESRFVRSRRYSTNG